MFSDCFSHRIALHAWCGFVSVELNCKIDAMFKRLKRYGYTEDNLTLSDLLDEANYDLFSSMCRAVGVIIVYATCFLLVAWLIT